MSMKELKNKVASFFEESAKGYAELKNKYGIKREDD